MNDLIDSMELENYIFPNLEIKWVIHPYNNSELFHLRTVIRGKIEGDGLFKDKWYTSELISEYLFNRHEGDKAAFALKYMHKFLIEAYRYSHVETPNKFIMDLRQGHARIWNFDTDQRSEKERLTILKQQHEPEE